MPKFDMSAAWEDCLQLMRAHSALTLAIAAVFLFLPTLAFAWFGPIPAEPPKGADLEQIMTLVRENFRQELPGRVVAALVGLVGSVAILRLWLARGSTSVGEALTLALTLFPTMLAAQLLASIALFGGLVLLILPGLYLAGRLALVSPVIADRGTRNPFEALRTSWDLTRNNGWAIFFFILLVTIVIAIAGVIVGSIVMAVVGNGEGVARIVNGFVEAGFSAIASFASLAIAAAAYRQLAAS